MTDGAGLGGFHESPARARQVLALAGAGGADVRRLAREAGIPGWLLSDDEARVPSHSVFRLWELAEHALGDPHAGLAAVRDVHLPTGLHLLQYLFSTAGTLRDGLRASSEYSYLNSTNGRLRVETETGSDVTYSYTNALDGGRGEELYLQLIIAGFCRSAQLSTGWPVVPLRVGFSQAAPTSHREFTDALGTSRIDFGTPVTTITFRTGDLELPMLGADPALARLLRRYAALLPVPPPPSWREHFQGLVAQAIQQGTPSLDTLARQLSVSRRTLQRQLAEHGTTWRAELDAARQRIAARASGEGTRDITRLARQLGYADPRAARRFLRRFGNPDQDRGKDTERD
jgi:AraC-like DNA-binding protein